MGDVIDINNKLRGDISDIDLDDSGISFELELDEEPNFFLQCAFCLKSEFVPIMKQDEDGGYRVSNMVCISKDCEGDSFISIKDGKTDGLFQHIRYTDYLDDL